MGIVLGVSAECTRLKIALRWSPGHGRATKALCSSGLRVSVQATLFVGPVCHESSLPSQVNGRVHIPALELWSTDVPSALIMSVTSTSPDLSAVILPIQVPANRAGPVGFDFGLGEGFLGSAVGATTGVGGGSLGRGFSSAVGATAGVGDGLSGIS